MDRGNRERFVEIARCQRPGDLMMLSCFNTLYWEETLERWRGEGALGGSFPAPGTKVYGSTEEFNPIFGFDTAHLMVEIGNSLGWVRDEELLWAQVEGFTSVHEALEAGAGSAVPVWPRFESKVVHHDERSVTAMDWGGITKKMARGSGNMPAFIDFPVKDRATWEEYRRRLDPDSPERWPADWAGYVRTTNARQHILGVWAGSMFGFLARSMKLEDLLISFYDDPVLVEDMMEHMLHFTMEVLKRVMPEIKVEFAMIWEDMCYNAGPMISPALFRKFMMPRYRQITDLLRSHGVEVIVVDTDGNVNELIPLWIECGINSSWPLEVAAGNDAVAIRKTYGRDFIPMGNIDKRALARGKGAIQEEVMAKVPFLLESGGYFPSVDHMVPPDVSFESYCHFIDTVRDVAGLPRLFS